MCVDYNSSEWFTFLFASQGLTCELHAFSCNMHSSSNKETTTFEYYCAQREGWQSKNKHHDDRTHQWSRLPCGLLPMWHFLQLTLHDYIEGTQQGSRAWILLCHNLNHVPYCPISLMELAKALINAWKGACPDEVCPDHHLNHSKLNLITRYGMKLLKRTLDLSSCAIRSGLNGLVLIRVPGGLIPIKSHQP